MKQLLVLLLAAGIASADIGLTYRVPETSYGVPSYQYNNADYNTGYTGENGYSYKAESSAQAGYQGANFGQQNLGYQTGFQSSSSSGADANNAGYQTANYQNNLGGGNQYYQGSNSGYNTVPQTSYQYNGDASQGGYQTFNQYQTSNEYQSSAVQKYQEYYNQWQQQPAQVFKHFYVHAAPEEPEEPKRRQPVVLPPPQKHYKIIFIKAPSQTVYTPQYIPVPQPNEEKTIVYVLVKKPGEQQDIVVPKLEQKAPAKPEVFFIKYNNKADSSAVINNIVNDYNKVDTVHFAGGSGSEGTGTTTGQYQTGTGQYQTGIGQYYQGSSGQYNKGTTQGSYNQYTQKESNLASAGVGSQTFGGLSNQAASTADSSAATATAGYSSSASSAGYTTGGSASTASSLNAISTSQGVPHETYGPPSFRV